MGTNTIKFFTFENASLQSKNGIFGAKGPQTVLSLCYITVGNDAFAITGTDKVIITINNTIHWSWNFIDFVGRERYWSGMEMQFRRLWQCIKVQCSLFLLMVIPLLVVVRMERYSSLIRSWKSSRPLMFVRFVLLQNTIWIKSFHNYEY